MQSVDCPPGVEVIGWWRPRKAIQASSSNVGSAAIADDRSADWAVSNVRKADIDRVVAEGCLESLAFLASQRPQCDMLTSAGAMLDKRKTQPAPEKRLLSSAPILGVQ